MPRKTRSHRRYFPRRKHTRRSHKLSIVDTASLAPGGIATYGEMGGIEGVSKDPQTTAASLMANYLGFNPQTGDISLPRAFENQWKPFVIIQVGKRVLGRVFPKLKSVKIFGKKVL